MVAAPRADSAKSSTCSEVEIMGELRLAYEQFSALAAPSGGQAVTVEAVATRMRDGDIEVTRAEVDIIAHRFDADNSGALDFDEFVAFWFEWKHVRVLFDQTAMRNPAPLGVVHAVEQLSALHHEHRFRPPRRDHRRLVSPRDATAVRRHDVLVAHERGVVGPRRG